MIADVERRVARENLVYVLKQRRVGATTTVAELAQKFGKENKTVVICLQRQSVSYVKNFFLPKNTTLPGKVIFTTPVTILNDIRGTTFDVLLVDECQNDINVKDIGLLAHVSPNYKIVIFDTMTQLQELMLKDQIKDGIVIL